ncbi:hypothetical protein HQ524_03125 [Candidatus Uhrbacteria bacterium]|nr:hypothetical protein [Candidatus Uhrbacteria bacterium]
MNEKLREKQIYFLCTEIPLLKHPVKKMKDDLKASLGISGRNATTLVSVLCHLRRVSTGRRYFWEVALKSELHFTRIQRSGPVSFREWTSLLATVGLEPNMSQDDERIQEAKRRTS